MGATGSPQFHCSRSGRRPCGSSRPGFRVLRPAVRGSWTPRRQRCLASPTCVVSSAAKVPRLAGRADPFQTTGIPGRDLAFAHTPDRETTFPDLGSSRNRSNFGGVLGADQVGRQRLGADQIRTHLDELRHSAGSKCVSKCDFFIQPLASEGLGGRLLVNLERGVRTYRRESYIYVDERAGRYI